MYHRIVDDSHHLDPHPEVSAIMKLLSQETMHPSSYVALAQLIDTMPSLDLHEIMTVGEQQTNLLQQILSAHPSQAKLHPEQETLALKLIERGTNPWETYARQWSKQKKTELVSSFTWATLAGSPRIIDRCLKHPSAPPISSISLFLEHAKSESTYA